MEKLNAIVVDGKVYELSSGDCFKCSLVRKCENGAEFCISFPCPDPEKDNCFRYSQSLTDKLNKR